MAVKLFFQTLVFSEKALNRIDTIRFSDPRKVSMSLVENLDRSRNVSNRISTILTENQSFKDLFYGLWIIILEANQVNHPPISSKVVTGQRRLFCLFGERF